MNRKYYELIDETLYHFTCENGLEVYLLQKKDYYKTYGIFASKFGSCNTKFKVDGKTYNVIDGAAHFLEHKMFEKDNYDVMDTFSKQQASSNAFTSFDKTAYLFSATANVNQNVITLLDFVQDLQLSDKSVEKEKPIIASEIAMYDDNVDWQSFFQSLQSMYHNNSVKIDIAGTKESINAITKEDLYLYYNHFYHPSNMVLFVCGSFDLDSLSSTIIDNQNSKEFKKINLKLINEKEPKDVVNRYSKRELDVLNTKYNYSFKVNDYIMDSLKQDIAMGVLMDILFAKSTDFFQDLFNNQKITNQYSYGYQQDNLNDYAFIQLSFTCDDEQYLTKYLDNYFKQDLTHFINEKDFEIIKAKYTGDFIRVFNSPEGIADSFISYYISGYDLFEVLEVINEVTIEDLKSLLVLFNDKYKTISLITPPKK
ncbi:putative Zn-dependent peptidase [Bacilli bacterium PM5-3]|nr:putative Zn-dependent peptidase [Bacilli bacterium PM5-3]MDH6603034.1 putative Zn-dependent peptidase [Bacilli bacterium PM5-9]